MADIICKCGHNHDVHGDKGAGCLESNTEGDFICSCEETYDSLYQSTIARLEADKARLVEALNEATETIRQMAEADRRQIQVLTEWKRRESDIDALVKRSNEVKK